mmetsp:Transcript_21498/g.63342  ORF Transcript_21498/g.63342 Transcript_21498/m.63342 type:complete len:218 (-) Transcript_21498:416-1069(-)
MRFDSPGLSLPDRLDNVSSLSTRHAEAGAAPLRHGGRGRAAPSLPALRHEVDRPLLLVFGRAARVAAAEHREHLPLPLLEDGALDRLAVWQRLLEPLCSPRVLAVALPVRLLLVRRLARRQPRRLARLPVLARLLEGALLRRPLQLLEHAVVVVAVPVVVGVDALQHLEARPLLALGRALAEELSYPRQLLGGAKVAVPIHGVGKAPGSGRSAFGRR